MDNKGFIATSLIYSFFLVFLALLAVILNSNIFNNRLISEFNDEILNRINKEIDINSDDSSYIALDLEILGITPNSTIPNFNRVSTTDDGVFIAYDNDGKSYYYRGDVSNNYIIFGNWQEISNNKPMPMYWRIIRVNGDGSLRLMFDGYKSLTNYITTPSDIAVWDTKTTSTGYNTAFEGKLYDFFIKKLHNTKYEEMISDSGFCSTKTSNVQNPSNCNKQDDKIICSGIEKDITDFSDYDKIVSLRATPVGVRPSLLCNSTDLYTVSNTKGNGMLTYPIGLISSNEIVMAGGQYALSSVLDSSVYINQDFYLYKGIDYWTMSLFSKTTNDSGGTSNMSIRFLNNAASISQKDSYTNGSFAFYHDRNGYIFDTALNLKSIGLYPVINIKEEYISTLTGDGSFSNPFIGSLDR